MGRLVDIDEVIKAVDKHTKDESEIVLDNDITCILEEVPTAYSIEKVVAELEVEREYSYADFEEYAFAYELDLNEYDDWFFQGLKRAIELVRKGGVE